MSSRRTALFAAAVVVAALAPLAARGDQVSLPEDAVAPNGLDRCDGSAEHQPLSLSGQAPALAADATPVLRFVQLSDSHVIDDDGPDVANGTPTEVVLDPAIGNTSATFLNEELTDEVLNAMIATINECQALTGDLSLTITTGDITDTNWLNVTRRVIDNIDGTSGQDTAFEASCGYTTVDANGQPKLGDALGCPIPAELLAIPTGKLVPDADAQSPDPENDPTYQFGTTRTLRQALESAATAAANGSHTIAAGLPPALRCDSEVDAGCANRELAVPYLAVFGNHDVSVKGTVTYQKPFGPPLTAYGRYFFESKREFINEWFASRGGDTGHGFGYAGDRLTDGDDRNDGWYSVPVPLANGALARFIVLDTTFDGVHQAVHGDGATRDQTEGLVAGNEATDPRGLEAGFMTHAQYEWLAGELAAAATSGEPVLAFSHHPDRSFVERQYPWADVETTAVALDELLGQATHGGQPSTVVAHIAGHTHANRVNPCRPGDCPIGDGDPAEAAIERGFWRFETASLINWPQEGRIVELFDLGGGQYALRLTMISPDQNDSAAARSRALSGYEEMCSVNAMMSHQTTDFCPNRGGVTVGAAHPAGSLQDRDVVLQP
jgi:hypothetical protein